MLRINIWVGERNVEVEIEAELTQQERIELIEKILKEEN